MVGHDGIVEFGLVQRHRIADFRLTDSIGAPVEVFSHRLPQMTFRPVGPV